MESTFEPVGVSVVRDADGGCTLSIRLRVEDPSGLLAEASDLLEGVAAPLREMLARLDVAGQIERAEKLAGSLPTEAARAVLAGAEEARRSLAAKAGEFLSIAEDELRGRLNDAVASLLEDLLERTPGTTLQALATAGLVLDQARERGWRERLGL